MKEFGTAKRQTRLLGQGWLLMELEAANATMPAGEGCGFSAFMAAIDARIAGRDTFGKAMAFIDWPYGAIPVAS